jgi:hypothetical protein
LAAGVAVGPPVRTAGDAVADVMADSGSAIAAITASVTDRRDWMRFVECRDTARI